MFGLDLADKVSNIAEVLAQRSPDKVINAYPYGTHNAILSVAKAYMYNDHPKDALQVLRIVKEDLFTQSPQDIKQFRERLDSGLIKSAVKIPKALQKLPLIYPTLQHRRADEVRGLFETPPSTEEKYTMFQEAQKYATVSVHKFELETAMNKINAPLLDYTNL